VKKSKQKQQLQHNRKIRESKGKQRKQNQKQNLKNDELIHTSNLLKF